MIKIKKFFEYNWQIRDEWFKWCKQLAPEALTEKRVGGVESILFTLFHIVDVEYSWIRGIQKKEDIVFHFSDYDTLEKVKTLSDELRKELIHFLKTDIENIKDHFIKVPWDKDTYSIDEILHHIVIHEIHHIGQLSVWSRELHLAPVQANFIGRQFNLIP
ncbi:putative damage-inducible protein DinB [Pseudogracilibacillus auburnensis]|uniref:Putative damage-inducible protein DinB n=1 Tax=Pseudogracilibacillus auburnensis TaxID=1494959 RepID=A0A2V3VWH4_9BACI|nr:putative damage-inducible protein DinB [Pseudogracilibacillus auburnensis]